jgi:hypothetical protein
LELSTAQAQQLGVPAYTQLSPFLEKCCLTVSANASYQRAERDIQLLTGVSVSDSSLQRLTQGHEWPEVEIAEPIEELSLDGGMVRLRTPQGQGCEWREYKALAVHDQSSVAFYKENEALVSWVNAQPFAVPFTCIGDGHDGVWNLVVQLGESAHRIEILDWYHLMENAHKVKAPSGVLAEVERLLWTGQSREAVRYLRTHHCPGGTGFIKYLLHHQSRLIDYGAWQEQGHSIGSGQVESLVKQIAMRVKLPGAQWSVDSVPQILKHRCAYLNGQLAS